MASIKNYEAKLTKTLVEDAPAPDSGDYMIRDTEVGGFCVRITSSGQRSWYVEKRGPTVKGVKTRSAFKLKIGTVGVMKVDDARKKLRRSSLTLVMGLTRHLG